MSATNARTPSSAQSSKARQGACAIISRRFCFPYKQGSRTRAPLEQNTLQTLPNPELAVIPIEKLRDYVLSPNHPRGEHKATVFKTILGIERQHASVLAEIIRSTLDRALAQKKEANEFGEQWATYHEIIGLNGRAAIVTVAWMFKRGAPDTPVLISSYVELGQQEKLSMMLATEQQK